MTTFVDSSVVLDLIQALPNEHTVWSSEQLIIAKAGGPVFVSDIVYSEIAYDLDDVAAVDDVINSLALARCAYTNDALFRAAKAFRRYRETTPGNKVNVLPDFLIGALAESEGHPLLTRNPNPIRHYFKDLEVFRRIDKGRTGPERSLSMPAIPGTCNSRYSGDTVRNAEQPPWLAEPRRNCQCHKVGVAASGLATIW